MNKRKILSLAMALSIVAIMAVGATLAYFTDTDEATNVFTTGDVEIELEEVFATELYGSKLIPATGSAQAGTLKNGVTKEITVKNLGSEEAYVRVHIAIPAILDDGDPSFDASSNILHFNYDKDSVGEGKWDWSKTTGADYTGDWNYYEQEIDGIDYNVYVVTYGTALAAETGVTAENAMDQVYLDSEVTNDDINDIIAILGDEWKIEVIAEGAQSAGFDDAYAALNAAFGVPGSYNPWAAE